MAVLFDPCNRTVWYEPVSCNALNSKYFTMMMMMIMMSDDDVIVIDN